MKDLIKKQDKEFDKKFANIEPFMQLEIKIFIAKVRKETAEYERERMLKNVGLLRQWLNERTDSMELMTNKDIETFLNK